jgi:ATP-binding cassette, subfamily B, multidrug efflux pump
MSLATLAQPVGRFGPAFDHLWSILRPWRRRLLVVAALVLAAAVLELVPPLLMRRVVDEHLTVGRLDGLFGLALLYLGATMAAAALGALGTYLTATAAEGALHALRVRLIDHLQQLPISFYDRTPLGEVLSRCTADVEAVDTLFSTGVAKAVADLVRLLTVAVAMVLLSPPLALVSALILPFLLAVIRWFQVHVRAAERENRRAVGVLNTHLQESLSGVEVIRAFERQPLFVARFRGALRGAVLAYNHATAYAALNMPAMATLAALATALLLWAGTSGAFAAWQISLGTLTAFVLLFQRFFAPLTALADEWQTVQSALSGAERIFELLTLPADPSLVSRPEGSIARNGRAERAQHEPAPAVELDAVVFGYLPDRPVLRGVSLAIQPGEHVALVGRTGAGKSSLLYLLGGLYAPTAGRLRIAGLDPGLVPVARRRRLIGAVPQTVQLFSGTVWDNLTLYDPSVERPAVERAARLAGADEFIRTLPAGYDTPLSGSGRGGGVQLSAGQRQLLALARALVADPAVLLLDEATAAIDAASDAAFRAALRADALGQRRAVLTVAHRLSTAREADRVLVLEGGRLVEEGPPEDLIGHGGRFAALVELEAAGWDWRAQPAELIVAPIGLEEDQGP